MITPAQARDFVPPRVYKGGYDREFIDRFVAELTKSYTAVWQERDRLRGAVETLQRELDECLRDDSPGETETLQAELAEYRQVERRLRKTLLSAERSAKQAKADARRESEQALRKARTRAKKLVTDAEAERAATLRDAHKNAKEEVRHATAERDRLEAEIHRLEEFEVTNREILRERLLAILAKLERDGPTAEARRAPPQPFEGIKLADPG
jgi:cell division septum initiation protein DivIVA